MPRRISEFAQYGCLLNYTPDCGFEELTQAPTHEFTNLQQKDFH